METMEKETEEKFNFEIKLENIKVHEAPVFIPGHIKNGRKIYPSLTIMGRWGPSIIKLLAFDELAEKCKHLSTGKVFDAVCRTRVYLDTVCHPDTGSMCLRPDGKPILVTKIVFIIININIK